MTDVSMSRVVRHDADSCVGSGHAALGLATWLGRAAAPTFATMALWSAFFSGGWDLLSTAMQGPSPISGMTVMFLLMSVFHASPSLKLIPPDADGAIALSAFSSNVFAIFVVY